MRRTFRTNEFCCPLIISLSGVQIDWWVSAIPDAIDSRFESRIMPDAPLNSSDNESLSGCTIANIDCRFCRELHHNTTGKGKKIVRRIVYAIMIDTHHVHFHFIRPSGNHVGSFFPLTWTTSSVMSFNHPEIQTRSPSHFWEYHPGSSTRPDCPSPFKSDHRQRLIFSVKSIRASGHETGENSERILSKSICHRDMPIREYAIAYED